MEFLVECIVCKKTLEQPVFIPCGHSMCKRHESESEKIACLACSKLHEKPDKGFTSNLTAEALLACKLDKLDLRPEHKVAFDSFKDLKNLIDEFKRLRLNPELQISREVSELKNKIDMRREEEKKKLDEEAFALIQELDDYEILCKTRLNGKHLDVSKEIEELIYLSESELLSWEKEIKTLERNVRTWKLIHSESILRYDVLRKECVLFKQSLFSDKLGDFQLKQRKFCDPNIEPLL